MSEHEGLWEVRIVRPDHPEAIVWTAAFPDKDCALAEARRVVAGSYGAAIWGDLDIQLRAVKGLTFRRR